jgi:hypothetical protein
MHFQPAFAIWNNDVAALAADLGLRVMNVRAWFNRDSIPPKYWPQIIAAAKKRGAKISFEDLVFCACQRSSPNVATHTMAASPSVAA